MIRLYPRELIIGSVLGTVTNIIVSAAVLSSPSLSERLGALSSGWVNGMLVVELVRMCLVAGLALVMIRQRHGLDSRSVGVANAIGVGAGTWFLLTAITVLAGVVSGTVDVGLALVATLGIWTVGAALAAIFVHPGRPAREHNRYLDRLDRERARGAWG